MSRKDEPMPPLPTPEARQSRSSGQSAARYPSAVEPITSSNPIIHRGSTGPMDFEQVQCSSKLKPGEILDQRYQIEEVLARGAMGWVYRGRHLHIDRVTALKVLDVDQAILNTSEYRERFCYEAQVIASLDHPNVIRVFDFGFFGSRHIPYIAMQFLDGHDLLREIEDKTITPTRALRFVDQALSALAIAHMRHIVHKDLKPANLFVQHPNTAMERLIVLDFGVARMQADEENAGMTRVGEIAGTPEYLPPEYITRQQVTPSLDVYSMALVLIELLIGRSLISGATPMERLLMHLKGPLQVPEPLASSVLGPVLKRALAPDHLQRYSDAAELLVALRKAEHGFLKEVRAGLFEGPKAPASTRPRGLVPFKEFTSSPLDKSPGRASGRERATADPAASPFSPVRKKDASTNPAAPLVSVERSSNSRSTTPGVGRIDITGEYLLEGQTPPRSRGVQPSGGGPFTRDQQTPPRGKKMGVSSVPRGFKRPRSGTQHKALGSGGDSQVVEFEKLFDRAVAAARKQLYEKALRLFLRCQAIQPGHRMVEHNISALNRRLNGKNKKKR